jgi:tetratricopeptide (TPR) repeat protein
MFTAAQAFEIASGYYREGQVGPAKQLFQYVLQLEPAHAGALLALGRIALDGGNPQQAIAFLARVADKGAQWAPVRTGDAADAAYALAMALEQLGHFEEAVRYYRKVVESAPDHAWALYSLSQLAAENRYTFTAGEYEHVQALVAAEAGNLEERSTLCFTLATLLDRKGDYDEAFRYYRQGNELRRQMLQNENRAYDPAAHRAHIDGLLASFDEAYFRHVEGWGRETELPVFVLGMPRSGTTLVEQIIASHPHVFGAGEIEEMPRMMSRLAGSAAGAEPSAPRPLPSRAAAGDLAAAYLRHLQRFSGEAPRVTVKSIENYRYLGVLATAFSGARVIYCRRNPLDVCLSCYLQRFHFTNYTCSLDDIGFHYRQHERLMDHWLEVLPLPILQVRYEDLVANQEAVTRKLLDFCGLDWDERCLVYFKNPRPVRTMSVVQVRRPLFTKSIDRWKHYEAHLGPLFQALRRPAKAASQGHCELTQAAVP